MYLLDTNVLSEIRKISQGKAHPAVAAWAERVDFDRCYLSVITLLEIEQGILRVRHRSDTRILPVDRHTARVCARLHIPDRRPYNDALIAASAIRHGLTLVTRNTRDFADLQVPLFNPFGEI